MALISISRYHDISAGHRVVGHEGKCQGLHGHCYRVHFECTAAKLDTIGRVIDFGVVKSQLCMWLEENWDHKMLLWAEDPLWQVLPPLNRGIEGMTMEDWAPIAGSIERLPFNPTAENMASFLLHEVAPWQLGTTGIVCRKIIIEETRKCSASVELTASELDHALTRAQ